MNEQDTASSGSMEEPRPSLKVTRLALFAAMALLIVAGTGLAVSLMLLLAGEFDWLRDGGDGISVIFLPGVIAFLLGLFQLGFNHRRGTPPIDCAPSALAGAAILCDAFINGIVLTIYLGSAAWHGRPFVYILDTLAIVLILTFLAVAGVSILLLHMRMRRLRQISNAKAAAPRWWQAIAWWTALAATLAATSGGTVYIALEYAGRGSFPIIDLISSLFLFLGHFFWQGAVWLLLPLTLMASDSYLLLRQRRGQEGQAAA